MSDFLNAIRQLIAAGAIRISEHGYDELADDGLTVNELLNGIDKAQIVEEYPDYPKGYDKPVVLVTSYRPDSKRWDQTFLHRIT